MTGQTFDPFSESGEEYGACDQQGAQDAEEARDLAEEHDLPDEGEDYVGGPSDGHWAGLFVLQCHRQ